MKKYIYIIFAGLMAASCVNTNLLPDDKTVDEDFWKTKSDVALMVNGAYAKMISSDVLSRLIVWGDFRSDELVISSSLKSGAVFEDLQEIATVNTQIDNQYSQWQSLYTVINYCNVVISKAESVMDEDPDYTMGDYLADVAQMKALRSLCYFYLVRNFRDVPYVTTPYMDNSQEMQIPQSAPTVVLEGCIADLKEASTNIISANAYTGWKSKGWLNKDAVNAILADIYLWRASVLHSASDYQECVNYCDLVIDSKNAAHVYGPLEVKDETNLYPALMDYSEEYTETFVKQNGEESIFELQMDGTNNANTALRQAYYSIGGSTTYGYMKAASMFGPQGVSNIVFNKTSDGRKIKFIYGANSDLDQYDIRKMVTTNLLTYAAPTATGESRQADRSAFDQNYIVYRLSDIMLMKAEALCQLAADDADTSIRQAFDIVRVISNRARPEGFQNDSIRWKDNSIQGDPVSSKIGMEQLILEERLRELCFEGKRWYDLMRYNYRHVEGVQYSEILAKQKSQVVNYKQMLNLAARKSSAPTSITSKMPTEPYLYMPVNKQELIVNAQLMQNPVYSSSSDWEKNY